VTFNTVRQAEKAEVISNKPLKDVFNQIMEQQKIKSIERRQKVPNKERRI